MQTFLPYSDFRKSLETLDNRRLGKQRVEGYQILRGMFDLSQGWLHHPAVKMWRGHAPSLVDYTLTACEVWCERGFSDTTADKVYELDAEFLSYEPHDCVPPSWTTDPRVLDSHKAMLFHKDPIHYKQFAEYGAKIKEYYWPVN